jgi:Family of unknown function (DUF5652)
MWPTCRRMFNRRNDCNGTKSAGFFGLDVNAAGDYSANMQIDPHHLPVWFALLIPVIILLSLWDGVWKVVGMWKSARNKQLAWFICLAIFNTVGILPIIYLTLCQKDRNQH